jgi:hypothetical protein
MNFLTLIESRGVTYLLFHILNRKQLILHAILLVLNQSFISRSRILFPSLFFQSTLKEIIDYPIFQTNVNRNSTIDDFFMLSFKIYVFIKFFCLFIQLIYFYKFLF